MLAVPQSHITVLSVNPTPSPPGAQCWSVASKETLENGPFVPGHQPQMERRVIFYFRWSEAWVHLLGTVGARQLGGFKCSPQRFARVTAHRGLTLLFPLGLLPRIHLSSTTPATTTLCLADSQPHAAHSKFSRKFEASHRNAKM